MLRRILPAMLVLVACSGTETPVGTPAEAVDTPPSATEPDESPEAAPAETSDLGIDVEAASAAIAEGAVVVDVRRQGEFDAGAIPGAVLIPHEEVAERIEEVDALLEGDRARTVVVYCRKGVRASKAKADLEAAGFTQVINGGGFDELGAALAPTP